MAERCPVVDWATDFDQLDPQWTADPYPIWEKLRVTCPVAETKRFGGVYLPTRHADIRAIAYDTTRFSSRQIMVRDGNLQVSGALPPVTSDPPHHRDARMVLMSAFRTEAVAALEQPVRTTCEALLAALPADVCDVADDYIRPVVLQALVRFLGLPDRDAEQFSIWVLHVLDPTDEVSASKALADIESYLAKQIARRRYTPGEGVLGHLLRYRRDGQSLTDAYMTASMRLLIVAGIDTTASTLGAALWHLARHDADRQRLVADPAAMPTAIDEFLRYYAPVTLAREIMAEAEVGGTVMQPGRMVLLCYPAANRDPEAFPDAAEFRIDRTPNRHLAFGAGIHRCIGDGMARLVLETALTAFLKARPSFRLNPEREVVWTQGSVRGPRHLSLRFS